MAPHLELPNELLFKILSQVLTQSVHTVVVSSEAAAIEWYLHVHHTLSAVCFSFREIMKGISSKAFQFEASETNPNLAAHVQQQLQSLRSLGAVIRDPSVPGGGFSIDSLDSSAPQLVQGYSLYVAIVYLRKQASHSNAETYQSTSATIFGAVITLSKVLYSRIIPREVAVMLRNATEDEAELSNIGVLVVKHCGLLSGFANDLAAEHDPQDEVACLRKDINKVKTEQMISIVESADVEFLKLFRRCDERPPPFCTAVWISELPDVYATLERVYDMFSKQPLISEDAFVRLRALVERWAPPPEAASSADEAQAPSS
ncbi:hypothetical protein C8R45DRAFT_1009849 [Mycena sanguinolenta]|nr:hypothetical protein C8R45DRAFT_1009849 [Mycena sanguinolenta]